MANLNTLLSILVIGSLILLCIILLANPMKVNRKANFYFAIFIFLWSTYWAEELLLLIDLEIITESFWLTIKFIQILTPIFLYLGVKSFTSPYQMLRLKDIIYLVLPIIYLATLIYNSKLPPAQKIDQILTAFMVLHALVYTIYSLLLINKHEKRIEEVSASKEEIDLGWLKQVIFSLLALSLFFGAYSIMISAKNLNFFGNAITFAAIVYVTYYLLKQKEIFDLSQDQITKIFSEETIKEQKQKLISELELKQLKMKLDNLMSIQQPYLDRELSLKKLALLMEISPHHLSYLLNEGIEENFFQYINRYRTDKAKELLLSPDHTHLSIMGIAFEAGFNSKTAFNTFFKKHTDMTPSEYVKNNTAG